MFLLFNFLFCKKKKRLMSSQRSVLLLHLNKRLHQPEPPEHTVCKNTIRKWIMKSSLCHYICLQLIISTVNNLLRNTRKLSEHRSETESGVWWEEKPEKLLLSYSHRLFIVMSEKVIGLVGLDGFSSINSEVKHCKTGMVCSKHCTLSCRWPSYSSQLNQLLKIPQRLQ